MATRDNLIATYQSNPSLQNRYTQQEYLDMFGFGTQTPTPDPDPTPTPTPTPDKPGLPNIINQNLGGGDNDGQTGFGKFGNLDPSTEKEVTVNFYDEEYGDFVPTKTKVYQNTKSGLFQTIDGKNAFPAFSNKGQAFGLFGLAAQMIGGKPDTVGGYVPGSIQGKFDGITDMFGSAKNIFQQKKIREQQSIQQELAKQAIQKQIAEAEAAQNAVTYQYNNPSQPGSGSPDDRSDAFSGGGANVPQADYTSTGRAGYTYGLADGGRVYLYNRLK